MTSPQWWCVGTGALLVLLGLTYSGASAGRGNRGGRPPDVAATPAGRVAFVVGGVVVACFGLFGWIA